VKYVVTVAGKAFDVVLNGGEVAVNDRQVSAELIAVPQTPVRELVLDGKTRKYAMTPESDGWSVMAGGEIHVVQVDDERAVRLGALAGTAERGGAGGKVKAPMPGLVLRVEVEEGQSVAAGDGLVVLEAMKMENEIKAPVDGRVTAVHVNDGQAVDKGTVLVEVTVEG
jgi:biotin carboxyl carrier protein